MEETEALTWSVWLAGVSTFAAVITLVVAAWSLAGSRRDSRERTRPLVVASLQVGPTFVHGATYLVVGNYGATAARDLTLTFDPALPEGEAPAAPSLPIRRHSAISIRARYAQPLEVLAPSQKLINLCTNRAVEQREGDQSPDLPETFTVGVRYRGTARKWPGIGTKHIYFEESFKLRMDAHDHQTMQNPGDSNDKEIRAAKASEAVAWALWSS
ncbi:hypothetical protein [Nesterenkonia sp. AN1]|uniref:hypothetical protein n=1 Tax=Nesterenkonia sp. AN1 TaxID=652017 RepID=UPI0012685F58|nr:hypothetical protein [Nesterenkonia sp. AN1]